MLYNYIVIGVLYNCMAFEDLFMMVCCMQLKAKLTSSAPAIAPIPLKEYEPTQSEYSHRPCKVRMILNKVSMIPLNMINLNMSLNKVSIHIVVFSDYFVFNELLHVYSILCCLLSLCVL